MLGSGGKVANLMCLDSLHVQGPFVDRLLAVAVPFLRSVCSALVRPKLDACRQLV